MNILYICDEYPPGLNGGIGTMVQLLSRALVQQGHQVYVVGLYSYRYGSADYEMDHGVKVFRLRYGLKLPVANTNRWYNLLEKLPNFIKRNLNGKKAFLYYIDFIKKIIADTQIDVVEVPDWNTFAYNIGFKVNWPSFSVPVIVKAHGCHTYLSHELKTKPDPGAIAIDQLLYRRADAYSAVSLYTAERIRNLFQLSKEVKVLYNSIAINTLVPAERTTADYIVFSGSLVSNKGVFSLMKAWNIVSVKRPDIKLLIFGKGKIEPLKAILDEQSKDTVIFKGHTSRVTLFETLSHAQMAIFPSYSECFSLAPLEAMAQACPVIYTCRSSGGELIKDGENGLLIDPDNIESIADAILLLLEDKNLQDKLAKNGRNTVMESFTIEQSAMDHIEYYQKIIRQFQ